MVKNYNSDVEAVDDLVVTYKKLRSEIGKVIIGQDEVVKDVIIPFSARAIVCSWVFRALQKHYW